MSAGGSRPLELVRIVSPVFALAAIVALAVSGSLVAGSQEEPFPHQDHEGLFPLCTGCHEGVPAGDATAYYPNPSSCAGCHDGVTRPAVAWSGPHQGTSNVRFEHPVHEQRLADAGEPGQACRSCHVPPGGGRMAVAAEVQLGACWGCHAHATRDHQIDGDCESCHVSLAASGFTATRIEALSVPPDHLNGSFVGFGHGAASEATLGRCATCHTRDRCLSCHVDGEREPIPAMPSAPAGMHLPSWPAAYPVPASHEGGAWEREHGEESSRDACATCHTSDDCLTCHVQPAPEAVSALLPREATAAPGVRLVIKEPESHRNAFFLDVHGGLSASEPSSCGTCHEESFCAACHDGPIAGDGYHPVDFVSRHAPSAFGRDTECANCHSPQSFCRECHAEVGLVGAGSLGAGYHDGSPLWLFRHGQPARQSLESCAGCHKQVDCVRCHGVLGAFKVNPHGPGFDAASAWARSPRACLACHVGNPIAGGR